MADAKITSLGALAATPASNDVFVLVDVSDTTMSSTGTDKKITYANVLGGALIPDGTTTGATSQAQTFTNGIVGPSWKPASDSSTAMVLANAAGTTWVTFNTTNRRVIIESAYVTVSLSNYIQQWRNDGVTRSQLGSNGNQQWFMGASGTEYGSVQYALISGNHPTIILYTGSTYDQNRFDIANRGTRLSLGYNADGETLVIWQGGRVGVGGITSPTAFLHLPAGTTAAASLRIPSGVAPTSPNAGDVWYTGSLLYRDGSANRTIVTTDSTQTLSNKSTAELRAASAAGLSLADDAGNLGVFVQDSTGYVGIKTSSPSSSLEIGADGANHYITIGGNAYFGWDNGSGNAVIQSKAGRGLEINVANDTFGSGTTNGMYINSSGNIGVGNVGPGAKLDVTGSVRGNYDTNTTSYFGRAAIGYDGATSDWASFAHLDNNGGATFALSQSAAGATWLNAKTATQINFAIAGTQVVIMSATQLYPNSDNAVTLGKSGNRWSEVWAANGTIQTSDERDKVAVKDSALGLSFIRALRPVSWVWANRDTPAVTEKRTDGDGNEYEHVVAPAIKTNYKRPHYGFIAQDVRKALDSLGVDDFAGYIYDKEADSHSLRYSEFLAPIVAALQELSTRLERLEHGN